ncbi:unnamed protein product [Gongylonema pulchrum]|uniref:Uncharacterized protein n=1 Tax=Gongylonema pulchrum TaxID=637853 RepID=A0A183DCU0_9BILA|nr:unnamed protein product [Gongylonema pulchrum]
MRLAQLYQDRHVLATCAAPRAAACPLLISCSNGRAAPLADQRSDQPEVLLTPRIASQGVEKRSPIDFECWRLVNLRAQQENKLRTDSGIEEADAFIALTGVQAKL